MTDTRNFLGIPVQGDITRGESRGEQRPIEELQPILQAVLDDPTIVEFGWRQYTPYFNDGDPCTFGVHGTWVRTTADEDADEDDLEMWGHRSLGKIPGHRDEATGTWVTDPYEGPDEARYLCCKALESAVEGGHFENVLLDAFGDHAEITVRHDGIEVEFYSHD
ncbi:hypothetical protein ACH45E_26790 [Streptomyces sp. NPDC020299]|uniref:hypothetical protein n=1 Tax=Streptomyces sp. NPDC020299 TaxID=3365067 RepID=UPI0037A0ECE8